MNKVAETVVMEKIACECGGHTASVSVKVTKTWLGRVLNVVRSVQCWGCAVTKTSVVSF